MSKDPNTQLVLLQLRRSKRELKEVKKVEGGKMLARWVWNLKELFNHREVMGQQGEVVEEVAAEEVPKEGANKCLMLEMKTSMSQYRTRIL